MCHRSDCHTHSLLASMCGYFYLPYEASNGHLGMSTKSLYLTALGSAVVAAAVEAMVCFRKGRGKVVVNGREETIV